MGVESFRFDGRRALVVGGATGMGQAAAQLLVELGADVVVMDHAEVTVPGVTALRVDLRDRQSIDDGLDACGGPIDALLSCAGVMQQTPGLARINFIGHRHLIARAVDSGMLGRGSAIAMISSTAGLGWEAELAPLLDYVTTPDFDAAVAWIDAHPGSENYRWSKQAVNAYVALQAHPLLKRGIRINAILPGPTNTPFTYNNDQALAFGQDYRDDVGIEAARAEDQAYPLVFLCSDAARYVSGAHLVVDAGYLGAGLTHSYEPAVAMTGFLLGKLAPVMSPAPPGN